MSKYQDEFGASVKKIENLLTNGENIIWHGKPKRFAFIFNKCAFMFPMALLWFLFDFERFCIEERELRLKKPRPVAGGFRAAQIVPDQIQLVLMCAAAGVLGRVADDIAVEE